MLYKITALDIQKGNPNRTSVFLDGRYAFGLATSRASRLKVGQTIAPEERAMLEQQDLVDVTEARALRYLGYRPRSQAEIRSHLQRHGSDEQVINQVLTRLAEAGLADDEAFARFWVHNRETFRPRGQRSLRYELRGKGVSDELIGEALQATDDRAAAYRVAAKWAVSRSGLDYPTFLRRLGGLLQRRGFDYGIIASTVKRVWQESTSAPEQEMGS